jgi:hypothetical protein
MKLPGAITDVPFEIDVLKESGLIDPCIADNLMRSWNETVVAISSLNGEMDSPISGSFLSNMCEQLLGDASVGELAINFDEIKDIAIGPIKDVKDKINQKMKVACREMNTLLAHAENGLDMTKEQIDSTMQATSKSIDDNKELSISDIGTRIKTKCNEIKNNAIDRIKETAKSVTSNFTDVVSDTVTDAVNNLSNLKASSLCRLQDTSQTLADNFTQKLQKDIQNKVLFCSLRKGLSGLGIPLDLIMSVDLSNPVEITHLLACNGYSPQSFLNPDGIFEFTSDADKLGGFIGATTNNIFGVGSVGGPIGADAMNKLTTALATLSDELDPIATSNNLGILAYTKLGKKINEAREIAEAKGVEFKSPTKKEQKEVKDGCGELVEPSDVALPASCAKMGEVDYRREPSTSCANNGDLLSNILGE